MDFIIQLNIEIDRNTKDIVSINAKNIPVETSRYEKNPELTTFVQKYEKLPCLFRNK